MVDRAGPWVVDASVAIKWVVVEAGSDEARTFLAQAAAERWVLLAPELWLAELAGVLWKRVSVPNGLLEDEAATALRTLRRSPVTVVPHSQIVEPALQLAMTLGITAYDALYVALAEAQDGVLVTFDKRLASKLRRAGFGDRVSVPGL